jgi:hypothetical protein
MFRASPTNSKATKKLVPQTLALRNGGETPSLNLLSIEFKRVLGEFESLLDESGKLANTATLLAKDFLSVCGTNDNLRLQVEVNRPSIENGKERAYLGTRMRDTDVATRVAFLRELTGEKFVQLGAEDTIRDELSLLADLSGHAGKLYKLWSWDSVSMG